MRKHISCYTKNMKDSSAFRAKMNTISDKDELLNFIKDYFKNTNI